MDPVALSGVKIKKARNSDDLVLDSPKKISASKVTILLKDLDAKKNYDRISVKAKVIRIDPPAKVSPTLKKQEVTIADAARLVDRLLLDVSYHFCDFIVRTFRSEKYISLPKEDASLYEIGEVAPDDLPDDNYRY